MSTTMDLRISADADIKRLREMVQKLEEKNAVIKTPESPRQGREPASPVSKYKNDRMNSSPVLERVAVRLHLDDVPLMDLSDADSEEEDSWLYTSPIHPPTPAHKSVTPYKYLKQSIDHQNDLNKVRGSLMAKLESIAAQEESLSRHDQHDTPPKDTSNMNRTFNIDERSRSSHYEDDLEPLDISGSDTYPIRRRGTPSRPPQTKLYRPWENLDICDDDDIDNDYDDPPMEAPIIRRGTFTKPVARRGQSPRSQDDVDTGVIRQRGRSSQSSGPGSDDEDFDNAPIVRRRGVGKTAVYSPVMPSDDIPVVSKVRPRGQTSQSYAASVPSDDEDDPELDAPVVKRRGAGHSGPVARSSIGSPQLAWQADNDDDDMGPIRPRRRGTPKNDDDDDDGNFDAPIVRRRGPPSPRPPDDSLLITAVRRRGTQADGQIRPRGSGLPSPTQGGIPTPSKRSTPTSRLRMSHDTEVKRRSLPQVPSDSLIHSRISGSNTPPRVRSCSPAGGVVPRGSKLAAPRRIPAPRAASSYYAPESEQNWQDGCY